MAQTFLDQAIAAPIMVGAFFTTMPLLEGKDFEESRRRLSAVRAVFHLQSSVN